MLGFTGFRMLWGFGFRVSDGFGFRGFDSHTRTGQARELGGLGWLGQAMPNLQNLSCSR